jgi:hypothetical protein
MAAIGISNRHNTIRGKTVNSHLFHMDVIEQFYWLVDKTSLLAHQMPIAIVCMRPEKWMSEPDTFWDYGTVSELCPTTTPCVLGDSDDFLMIELRSEDTYDDGLRLGWPTNDMIGQKLAGFVTKDHTVYGRHQLVMHSDELPPEVGAARAKLHAFVSDVFRHFDKKEIEHEQHPFWAFQSSLFDIARKAATDGRLTPSLWSRNSKALSSVIGSAISDFKRDARKSWSGFMASNESDSARDALSKQEHQELAIIENAIKVEEAIHQRDVALALKDVREQRMIVDELKDDADFAAERAAGTQPNITRLTYSAQASRTTNHIGPFDTMYAPLRHVRRIVSAHSVSDGGAVLVICSSGLDRAVERFGLTGHTLVALSPRAAAHLEPDDLPADEQFGLCVADLDAADMFRLRRIFDCISPRLAAGGKFIAFHFHESLRAPIGDPLFIRKAFPRCDWGRVYFSGTYLSAAALYAERRLTRLFCRFLGEGSSTASVVVRIAAMAPAWVANMLEDRISATDSTVPQGQFCTATTIEIDT